VETQTTTRAEQAMLSSLKFCERCKGSIPEAEFHDGRALHVGAKCVHVECLMKRSVFLPALALLVALYAAGAATWLIAQRGSGEKAASAPASSSEATAASGEARRAFDAAQSAERRAATAEAELAALRTEIGRTAKEAKEQLQAAQDAMMRRVSEAVVEAGKRGGADPEGRLAKLEATLAALSALDGKFNGLGLSLTDLRKKVAALEARAGAAPESPPPGEKPPEKAPEKPAEKPPGAAGGSPPK
jgi:hypothetical protein